MRRTTRLLAGAALGLGVLAPVALPHPVQAAPGDPLTVNIFHLNDSHSHLDPELLTVDLGTGDGEVAYERGGWPRVDAMIKRLRDVDHMGENNVTIHAGDAITGTVYYTLFKGEAEAALMNETCFDIFELGNHEFDDGDDDLAAFLDFLAAGSCGTDVLGANVVPQVGTPLDPSDDPTDDYIKPFVVKDFLDSNGDTQQVAFIGLDIAQKTKASSRPFDTTEFLDELTTAQSYIDQLRDDEGIENIVLVTHYGYENDLALAAELTGVDAIVGGDSHTLLGDPADFGPFLETTSGEYATVVENADGDPVCVVQAWQYSTIVGELTLNFDGNGKLDGTTPCSGTPHLLVGTEFFRGEDGDGNPVPVDATEQAAIDALIAGYANVTQIDPDPAAVAVLDGFREQVDELKAQVIAEATEPLCSNRLPGDLRSAGICSPNQVAASGARSDVNGGFIQQIVADAFLDSAQEADIAIQNGGGVRVAVDAGEVSMAKAIEVLPFSNTLVYLDVTGQQLVDVLEEAVANFADNGGSDGSYPYGSAIRWHLDLTKPAGERFSNVEVRAADGTWGPIDLAATYKVVTNDFIASGQDGYTTFGEVFANGDYVDSGILYTQGLIDWIQNTAPKNDQGVPQLSAPPASEFSTQSFVPADGELLAPINPTRILDTRAEDGSGTVGVTYDGLFRGDGELIPEQPYTLQVGGRAGVPPTATAVSLNLTAAGATGLGYLTLWPCDVDQPLASSINYNQLDSSIANSVVVPLAEDGTVCIESAVTPVHVVADVTGWSASSDAYTPLVPARLLDTRADDGGVVGKTIDGEFAGDGIVEPGTTVTLDVAGRGNVPEDATAVTVNITADNAQGPGYLVAWPCDTDQPLASTINYLWAAPIANSIVVPLSGSGTLCIESAVSATHVVVDVTGAYGETDEFGGLVPARLLDTRQESGTVIGKTIDGEHRGQGTVEHGEVLRLPVVDRGGVPEGVRLVALNLTATENTGAGFLTLWDCSDPAPLASSINFTQPGTNIANSVIVPVSPEGEVCIVGGVSATHVVADVTAYYL